MTTQRTPYTEEIERRRLEHAAHPTADTARIRYWMEEARQDGYLRKAAEDAALLEAAKTGVEYLTEQIAAGTMFVNLSFPDAPSLSATSLLHQLRAAIAAAEEVAYE